jgi:hypothetical protein
MEFNCKGDNKYSQIDLGINIYIYICVLYFNHIYDSIDMLCWWRAYDKRSGKMGYLLKQ